MIGAAAYAAGALITIALWAASMGSAVRSPGAGMLAASAPTASASDLKSPIEILASAIKDASGALSEYASAARRASREIEKNPALADTLKSGAAPKINAALTPNSGANSVPASESGNRLFPASGPLAAMQDSGKNSAPETGPKKGEPRLAALIGGAPRSDADLAGEISSLLSRNVSLRPAGALERYAEAIQKAGEQFMAVFLGAGARIIALGQELGQIFQDAFSQITDTTGS